MLPLGPGQTTLDNGAEELQRAQQELSEWKLPICPAAQASKRTLQKTIQGDKAVKILEALQCDSQVPPVEEAFCEAYLERSQLRQVTDDCSKAKSASQEDAKEKTL